MHTRERSLLGDLRNSSLRVCCSEFGSELNEFLENVAWSEQTKTKEREREGERARERKER